MKKMLLAITIRSFDLDQSLKKQLDDFFDIVYLNETHVRLTDKEVALAIQDADAVIAGTEPFSSNTLRFAKNLKFISRVGVGVDSIDLQTANEKNIRVLITQSSTVQPVAEHAIALLLCAIKRICEYNNSIRSGNFSIREAALLQGKWIGIIGLGRIGSRVGELLTGFGCQIRFYDPFSTREVPKGWVQDSTLDDLVSNVDIITLHIPAQEGNHPILDQERFNLCRDGVIIINTARGSLIDENALMDALRAGKVSCAGLDVFADEPYSGHLLSSTQVIATPHVASNTKESRKNMENESVTNLINAIREMNS